MKKYVIDKEWQDKVTGKCVGDMAWSFVDMWEGHFDTIQDAEESVELLKEDEYSYDEDSYAVYIICEVEYSEDDEHGEPTELKRIVIK